jgi:hypothetical protein
MAPPGSAQLPLSVRRISRRSPASLITAAFTDGTRLFAGGGLRAGTPEPVLVLLNGRGNPHAGGYPHADAVVAEAVGESLLPVGSPKVLATGSHGHHASLDSPMQSSIVERLTAWLLRSNESRLGVVPAAKGI